MKTSKIGQIVDAKSLDALTSLMDSISEERFKGKVLGISYRTISHWIDMGIIRFAEVQDSAKRRYSFVDYVWIKVVEELRAFGVGIPTIQSIAQEVYAPLPTTEIFTLLRKHPAYDALLEKLGNDTDRKGFEVFLQSQVFPMSGLSAVTDKFNHLHSMVADAIATRKPVAIVVFKSGEWLAYAPDKREVYTEEELYQLDYESHIRINLTQIVFRFMVQEYNEVFTKSAKLLTEQELKVLECINTWKFKAVMVYFNDKGLAPVEIKGKYAAEKLQRVFQQGAYSEFVITDIKGEEISIKATQPSKWTDTGKAKRKS